jgi:hypothetical protein
VLDGVAGSVPARPLAGADKEPVVADLAFVALTAACFAALAALLRGLERR